MGVSPGYETHELLSSVVAYPLSAIGSPSFVGSYCVNLERLSVQAHATADSIAAAGGSAVPLGRRGVGNSNNHNAINNGNVNNSALGPSNGGDNRGGNHSSGNDTLSSLAAAGGAATPGLDGILSALTPSGNNNGREYIVDAFLEDDERIRSIIRTLLALELWRTRVLLPNDNDGEGGQCKEEEEEEEEVVEFEIEGGSRLEEEYNSLNDVDGGEDPSSNSTCNAATFAEISGPSAQNAASTFGGLAPRLAANGNVLRTAFVLHAETTIVSMLSLIFYHGVPPGLIEDDDGLLLSLIDYCARQLVSFSWW